MATLAIDNEKQQLIPRATLLQVSIKATAP